MIERSKNLRRHGGTVHHKAEYNSWRAMKSRCYYEKYWCYRRYGGRGIVMDERWLGPEGFINFLSDLGKKPTPKHSIDRIDNDGNYTPENCRWSDVVSQRNNTSSSRFETIDGVTKTVTQWCREYGVKVGVIYNRQAGENPMTFEEALKTPLNPAGKKIRPQKMPRPKCVLCGTTVAEIKSRYCTRDCYLKHRWGYVR